LYTENYNKFKDERVRLTQEAFDGIRQFKMLSYEYRMLRKMNHLKKKESE